MGRSGTSNLIMKKIWKATNFGAKRFMDNDIAGLNRSIRLFGDGTVDASLV